MTNETALTRRYKIVITIAATLLFGLGALWAGQSEIASAAGGALFGYLGKMNGYNHEDEDEEDT